MEVEQTGTILKALDFAAFKHRNQRCQDKEASHYINHPITIANLLCNVAGVTDAVTLVGAILHDTVECNVVKLLVIESEN